MTIYVQHFPTPLGDMLAAVNEEGALIRLAFCAEQTPRDHLYKYKGISPDETVQWSYKRCQNVIEQLDGYFRHGRTTFTVPVAPYGTDFQQAVWAELQRIPYGTTINYGQLAERIGNPAASRAVGRANATNPIPVVIPCHRVIGANGTLTGYEGGIWLKEGLLALEGVPISKAGEQLALLGT